jgi:hypothetical protein
MRERESECVRERVESRCKMGRRRRRRRRRKVLTGLGVVTIDTGQ